MRLTVTEMLCKSVVISGPLVLPESVRAGERAVPGETVASLAKFRLCKGAKNAFLIVQDITTSLKTLIFSALEISPVASDCHNTFLITFSTDMSSLAYLLITGN